CHQHNSYPHTF
nr:immunoglobulin light chain junction region [Macaca mulatta]MOX56155.1 immunoglobulin light chain junction region [Macaca mulatta]